jgi:hypothetical protein
MLAFTCMPPPACLQVHSSFRDFAAEKRAGSSSGGASGSSGGSGGGLAALLKPPTHMIFPGDWETLRRAGTALKRWLLVNIQARGGGGGGRGKSAQPTRLTDADPRPPHLCGAGGRGVCELGAEPRHVVEPASAGPHPRLVPFLAAIGQG